MNSVEPVPSRIARILIGSIAVALAFAGQVMLYVVSTGWQLGLGLCGVAVVIFVWACVQQPPRPLVNWVVRWDISYRKLLLGAAVILSAMAAAASVLFERANRANYWPVLCLWAASAVACGLALGAGDVLRVEWRKWIKAHSRELIAIGLVTLVGAALRFYALGQIPRVINGDEGLIGQAALLAQQPPLANPFALFENLGGLFLQTIGLAIYIFGQTPFALRLVPAVGGTLAILAVYLLGRRLFGVRIALIAAALLAISHAHIHFSRTVAVSYTQGTWLIPLELYFFVSGLEERSALRLAIGGMILGLHFSVYLGAQIIAGYLLVYLVVAIWLCRPLIQTAGRSVFAFLTGVVVVVLPEAVFALRHQNEFLSRLNSGGTFQTGWLQATMAQSGQGAIPILADRVAHAFLSFNYYPAQDFYGATIPLLDAITGVLFLLGLGYGLWRTRDHRYLLLNGYFWSATVAVGVFAIPPSADSYRMLVALPAAVLFAAIGLEQVLRLFTLTDAGHAAVRRLSTALLLAVILLFNARAYFVDFAAQCRYGGDPQTRFASYLGNFLRTLDRDMAVYLLSDDIFLYGTHSSVGFLSRDLPVTNWTASVNDLKQKASTVIIAPPSRIGELRDWAGDHPGGKLHEEYDCEKLMLLAYTFP